MSTESTAWDEVVARINESLAQLRIFTVILLYPQGIADGIGATAVIISCYDWNGDNEMDLDACTLLHMVLLRPEAFVFIKPTCSLDEGECVSSGLNKLP